LTGRVSPKENGGNWETRYVLGDDRKDLDNGEHHCAGKGDLFNSLGGGTLGEKQKKRT